MNDFDYAVARSVEEAVGLLGRGLARPLAGGTDLLVQLREGGRDADLLVDVKKIPELMRYEHSPQTGLKLGAATTAWDVYSDPQLVEAYPALVDAARIIGGWQIQSRASIGGNLCNSSPAADSTPALIALGAECEIAGPGGRRRTPVATFCTAPGKNVLGPAELLVALHVPAPTPHSGSRYLRFIPRNEMDIAVVGAGAWLTLDPATGVVLQARAALGAVGPRPIDATEAVATLRGVPPTEEAFARAAEAGARLATPITDMRGTAEYRRHVAGVLLRRAFEDALERARGATVRNPQPHEAAYA